MRAIKRVRYAEKELVKLKATVPWHKEGEKTDAGTSTADSQMQMEANAAMSAMATETEVDMTDDNQVKVPKRKKGPLKDEHGHYPPWYKQRSIKKLQKRARAAKRTKKRAQKRMQVTQDGGTFF